MKYYLLGEKMDRYEKGKECLESIQGSSVEEIFNDLEDIAPDLSRFVVEFPYSEIYTRKEVDLKTRELCTVAALTVIGTIPQLKDHINAALNVGNAPSEIVEIIMQMSAYAGFPKAINGVIAAKEVFYKKNLVVRIWLEGHDRECVSLTQGQLFEVVLKFNAQEAE